MLVWSAQLGHITWRSELFAGLSFSVFLLLLQFGSGSAESENLLNQSNLLAQRAFRNTTPRRPNEVLRLVAAMCSSSEGRQFAPSSGQSHPR